MKYSFLFITLLVFSLANAQLKIPGVNGFRSDVQKIIEDYPSGFSSIRGDQLVINPQTIEYASKVIPAGVKDPVVIEYSSEGKHIFSWQATLLSTESFTDAEKKYKWLFNQLKGMNVKHVVDQYTLRGKYEAPSESLKFATSELTVASPPQPLKKMTVEVALQYEFPEWQVKLLIYEKEKDPDQKGSDMN